MRARRRLRWDRIDFQAGTIRVDEQWNAIEHAFTPPKHGSVRTIALTEPARARLLSLPRESEFAFTTLRGSHYRPSSRSHHWNRVRCAAGSGDVDLYTATRHYFAWYAWNVLVLDARDIALHFGHQDGGGLVRTRYGHADAKLARERIREAFQNAPTSARPARPAQGRVARLRSALACAPICKLRVWKRWSPSASRSGTSMLMRIKRPREPWHAAGVRIYALARDGDVDGLIAELRNPIDHDVSTPRLVAARKLGKCGDSRATKPVAALLEDGNESFGMFAAQALSRLPADDAETELRACFERPGEALAVRGWSMVALAKLALRPRWTRLFFILSSRERARYEGAFAVRALSASGRREHAHLIRNRMLSHRSTRCRLRGTGRCYED